MVINEKINEQIIDMKLSIEIFRLSEIYKFLNPKTVTAPSVGIDNRKDIFAASILLNFKNLAAVKAIPNLLTPGTKDKICKKPIMIADFRLKSFLIFFSNLNLSLI